MSGKLYGTLERKQELARMASNMAGPLMVQAMSALDEAPETIVGAVADCAVTLAEAILKRVEAGSAPVTGESFVKETTGEN